MIGWSDERRGFIRIPFNTEVEVVACGRTVHSTDGLDISMSGVRISCCGQGDFAIGSLCNVKIILRAADSKEIIEAKGTIVRSEKGSLGIRFTEIDLDSYHHLRQLILNNTTEPERAEKEFFSHWGIKRIEPHTGKD